MARNSGEHNKLQGFTNIITITWKLYLLTWQLMMKDISYQFVLFVPIEESKAFIDFIFTQKVYRSKDARSFHQIT